jgi:hypothetical protein
VFIPQTRTRNRNEKSKGQFESKRSTNILQQGKATQQNTNRPKQPQAKRRASETQKPTNLDMTEEHDTKRSDTRDTPIESECSCHKPRKPETKMSKVKVNSKMNGRSARQSKTTQQEATEDQTKQSS